MAADRPSNYKPDSGDGVGGVSLLVQGQGSRSQYPQPAYLGILERDSLTSPTCSLNDSAAESTGNVLTESLAESRRAENPRTRQLLNPAAHGERAAAPSAPENQPPLGGCGETIKPGLYASGKRFHAVMYTDAACVPPQREGGWQAQLKSEALWVITTKRMNEEVGGHDWLLNKTFSDVNIPR